jgi:hypothetical protein
MAYKLILRLIVSHQLQTPILGEFHLNNLKLNTVVAWLCSRHREEWKTNKTLETFSLLHKEGKGMDV